MSPIGEEIDDVTTTFLFDNTVYEQYLKVSSRAANSSCSRRVSFLN